MLAYESGRDEPAGGGRGAAAAGARGRPGADRVGARAAGPRDEPAGALHGGEPRQGARGARHRAPVDLRLDHGDDPRPRLRLQEGHRARADVPRVRGHAAPREALRPARRLRLHRAPRGRPRPDRRRATRSASPGSGASTSATATPGLHALVTDHLEGIDAREVNSIAIPRLRHRRPGRPLRPVPRARRAAREHPGRPGARRAHGGARGGAARAARRAPSASLGTHPETGPRDRRARGGRYGPYVTEVLPEGDGRRSRARRRSSRR